MKDKTCPYIALLQLALYSTAANGTILSHHITANKTLTQDLVAHVLHDDTTAALSHLLLL